MWTYISCTGPPPTTRGPRCNPPWRCDSGLFLCTLALLNIGPWGATITRGPVCNPPSGGRTPGTLCVQALEDVGLLGASTLGPLAALSTLARGWAWGAK